MCEVWVWGAVCPAVQAWPKVRSHSGEAASDYERLEPASRSNFSRSTLNSATATGAFKVEREHSNEKRVSKTLDRESGSLSVLLTRMVLQGFFSKGNGSI